MRMFEDENGSYNRVPNLFVCTTIMLLIRRTKLLMKVLQVREITTHEVMMRRIRGDKI